jgi:hypothetical protein
MCDVVGRVKDAVEAEVACEVVLEDSWRAVGDGGTVLLVLTDSWRALAGGLLHTTMFEVNMVKTQEYHNKEYRMTVVSRKAQCLWYYEKCMPRLRRK